jgi:hypothetical protein
MSGEPALRNAAFAIGKLRFCRSHRCPRCKARRGPTQDAAFPGLQDLIADPATMSELRRIVYSCDLGVDISRTADHQLIAEFTRLFDAGVLQRCDELDDVLSLDRSATVHEGPIGAAAIARVLGSKDAHQFEGQSLRVIPAELWRRLREEGQYQVVPTEDARRIIAQLAVMPGATAAEKKAWQAARKLLPEPGVSRFDSGLLLLRIVPRRIFRKPSSEAAITPSQLARMITEKHWIEIQIVDEDGVGVSGIDYSITAPDNSVYTGTTDASGIGRVDNLVAGECKITFPELDKSAYRPA